MTTYRKLVFRDGEIYHVFNRGIERRSMFSDRRTLGRAKQLIKFYRHKEIPMRFSKAINQPQDIREKILTKLYASERLVDILCYCLMPNHFHFLLRQNSDKGIPIFISNFTNAYTKYLNTRQNRTGTLFEGAFKAVRIESDEQLIHVSRYIHINPVVSCVVKEEDLLTYPWSSYPEYLSLSADNIVEKEIVLQMFSSVSRYQEFIADQIDYGKKLEEIKHLVIE
ncbi:MAG: hypothetical protein C4584_02080 [Armatimonadetes bacterium]|nr:MAG: hypothetical protein C4584_02080 [Armatimonadota bacterium]